LRLEIAGIDVARGVPRGQATGVLAYLLAARGLRARREALAEAILPGRDQQEVQGVLRPLLSRLRRAVAPATLEGREELQLLVPEPVWLDVDAAREAVERARRAGRETGWDGVRAAAATARDLLAGGLLPAVEGEWVEVRRREVAELELEALEWLARAQVELGGPELVAAEAASRELIARAPFRETGHRFLMAALAAAGNAAEALRVYDDLRVLLRNELGVAPAPEVQALHQRLLAGDAAVAARVAASAPAPAPRRLPRALSPSERSIFIGREAELARLRESWRAARGGDRRLVLVAGEPGIGKTRLTGELARAVQPEGTVLYASCQQEALVSYQPFVEALRAYVRDAGLEWVRDAAGPGAAELGRIVPELAAALPADARPAPVDPEARRYLLYDEVAGLLAAASRRVPLLLVLDDLHWADRATLHLLGHVLRSGDQAALLVVGTCRDSEVGEEHPLTALLGDLRRERLVERVPLTGLDEPDVAALIGSRAGRGAPTALVDAVHARTAGNPFFVEEVMRHLIETGGVFEADGRWAVAPPAAGGVPDGVREVISGRLARLSPSCRAMLAAAAVLGREFSYTVLHAVAGSADDDEVMLALEEAVAAQLVVEVEGRPDADHAFTHALVRETLYAMLTGPRRQRMHARAAAALEGAGSVAALAVHHRLAGPAGDVAKAIDYSLRAGAEARERFAWDEAASHWEGAAEAMERAGGRDAEREQLSVALAELMVIIGDAGRHVAHLEQALALDERRGDRRRAAQAHSRLGMALSLMDSINTEHMDIRRAFEHFDAARAVLAEDGPSRAMGHLETGVSAANTYALRIPDGLAAGARGMDAGEQLGDEVLWAGAAEAYAWHAIIAGRIREGLAILDQAFAIGDRHQRPFHALMAVQTQGQLTWGLCSPDEAQRHFEQPAELAYFRGTSYRGEIADALGRCHAVRGELDAARRLLPDARPAWLSHSLAPLIDLYAGEWDKVKAAADRVYAVCRRAGNRWDEWAASHLAARVHALHGQHDATAAALEDALTIVCDGSATYFELWVRPDLARVRSAQGRHEEALAHVSRCRAVIDGGENWRGRAGLVALAEGVVRAGAGETGAADTAFTQACQILARYKLRLDQADALVEWARAGGGAEKLDRALAIYETCGAGRAWLERARRVCGS
jgi:DNA-binding SARP family transcriptional activator/tetratricopeptide (TPR) repeat protein